MARRKGERPADRGARRAETDAVAAYLSALKGPRPSGSSKAKREGLMRRRAQVEQWISEGHRSARSSWFSNGFDVDAQLAQLNQQLDSPSWRKRS